MVKWVGLNRLKKALDGDRVDHYVKQAMQVEGELLEMTMKEKAVFGRFTSRRPPYTVGDTQGSIRTEMTNDGFTAEVYPTTEYAGYLELGTRKMDAQPYIEPALDERAEEFASNIAKAARKAIK